MPVIRRWKPKGMTPNEQLTEIKRELGYIGKACYAGRLDPMASGEMIYLVGGDTTNGDDYMGCKKEYEFYIAVGISTVSMDCLGEIVGTSFGNQTDGIISNIMNGKYLEYEQTMPIYSAYKARNKETGEKLPLWKWAEMDQIDKVELPKRRITLDSLEYICQEKWELSEYISTIKCDIDKVKSFSTQQIARIQASWKELALNQRDENITLVKCRAIVNAGTYIRFLSNMIGNDNGVPCHAYDIKRTRIFDN